MPSPGQELASIDFESMLGGPLVAVINAQSQAAMSSVNFIKEVGFEQTADEQDPKAQRVGKPIYVSFKYPKEVAPYSPASGEVTSLSITNPGSGYPVNSTVPITITGGGGSGATGEGTIDATGKLAGVSVTNAGKDYTSDPSATVQAPPTGGTNATVTAKATVKPLTPAQFQEMTLDVPILTMLPLPFIRIESTTIDFNAKINSVEFRKTDTSLKLDTKASAKGGLGFVSSVKLKVSTSYKRSTQQGTNVERTYSMAVHIRAVQDEMPAGMERILGLLEDAITARPTKIPGATEI